MSMRKEIEQGGHAMAENVNGKVYPDMPSPTEEDLHDPVFERIWLVVKSWDVNAPEYYQGYCGFNGSHVKLIMDALRGPMHDYHERVTRLVHELVSLNPRVDSPNGDLLTVLSDALIKYEAKYYPITDFEKDSANESLMPNEFWDKRIKKIMERTPWPNSLSTYLGFKQLQNEMEQTFSMREQDERPRQLVPVYQVREVGTHSWLDVSADYKNALRDREHLEFRTLYRGWD